MSIKSQHATSWVLDTSEAGLRIDVTVTSHFEDVSRAQIKRWIALGRVTIDGNVVRPSKICRAGEHIEVEIPSPAADTPNPETIPLSVIYEDKHLIVVDKAAGMVVHPGPGHSSGTLVNALLSHCNDLSGIGGVERPGIVHRLDGGTSGVLVVAKHDQAHQMLSDAFKNRLVEKHYSAIVYGTTPERFIIDVAIGRDRRDRKKISSHSTQRKTAISEIERVEQLFHSSLLNVRIHTGRTHQIRVHLSEAGFPLIGDHDYVVPSVSKPLLSCFPSFSRPALHARQLSLQHPMTGKLMSWEATLPKDMLALLTELREKYSERNQ